MNKVSRTILNYIIGLIVLLIAVYLVNKFFGPTIVALYRWWWGWDRLDHIFFFVGWFYATAFFWPKEYSTGWPMVYLKDSALVFVVAGSLFGVWYAYHIRDIFAASIFAFSVVVGLTLHWFKTAKR